MRERQDKKKRGDESKRQIGERWIETLALIRGTNRTSALKHNIAINTVSLMLFKLALHTP